MAKEKAMNCGQFFSKVNEIVKEGKKRPQAIAIAVAMMKKSGGDPTNCLKGKEKGNGDKKSDDKKSDDKKPAFLKKD